MPPCYHLLLFSLRFVDRLNIEFFFFLPHVADHDPDTVKLHGGTGEIHQLLTQISLICHHHDAQGAPEHGKKHGVPRLLDRVWEPGKIKERKNTHNESNYFHGVIPQYGVDRVDLVAADQPEAVENDGYRHEEAGRGGFRRMGLIRAREQHGEIYSGENAAEGEDAEEFYLSVHLALHKQQHGADDHDAADQPAEDGINLAVVPEGLKKVLRNEISLFFEFLYEAAEHKNRGNDDRGNEEVKNAPIHKLLLVIGQHCLKPADKHAERTGAGNIAHGFQSGHAQFSLMHNTVLFSIKYYNRTRTSPASFDILYFILFCNFRQE